MRHAPDRYRPLISARNLTREFTTGSIGPFARRRVLHAVRGVSFDIAPGETFALVGESGCGKSTVGRLVLGLDTPSSGDVSFDDRSIFGSGAAEWRQLRRHMQMIFQDTHGTLDPRRRIAEQVREPLDIFGEGDMAARLVRVAEYFGKVGLSTALGDRYPYELSGGQQQRVVIARALILAPRFLVCDEPVSALDMSIQAQVVELLRELQKSMALSYLFISHDLAIVRHIAHRVAVMYLGELVEVADCDQLFSNPVHPYSRALITSVPVPDPTVRRQWVPLKGEPPSPFERIEGCPFHDRCPEVMTICRSVKPVLQRQRSGGSVACHLADDVETFAERKTA